MLVTAAEEDGRKKGIIGRSVQEVIYVGLFHHTRAFQVTLLSAGIPPIIAHYVTPRRTANPHRPPPDYSPLLGDLALTNEKRISQPPRPVSTLLPPSVKKKQLAKWH